MRFNEAQRAFLTDYDDGKYAHLLESDPRSYSVTSVPDPLFHFMLDAAAEPIEPVTRPCEIAASIAALDAINHAKAAFV